MFGGVRIWFQRRLLRRLSKSASSKIHEAATVLYTIREHTPEVADSINMVLDDMLYPSIHEIDLIEEALCRTSKKTGEQKSTLTLVK